MNKETEKYVWYYLAVYIVVLLIFASFQYFGVCDGESLNCKTKWEKVKDILQTTAYIVTPIVAIIGFVSWKEQYNKKITASYYQEALDTLKNVSVSVHNLKNLAEESQSEFINMGKKYYIECLYDENYKLKENLSDLQNNLIFIDLINKNKDMDKVFFKYIKDAKSIIEEVENKNLFEIEEISELKELIFNQAERQGELIKTEITKFVDTLHENIKA